MAVDDEFGLVEAELTVLVQQALVHIASDYFGKEEVMAAQRDDLRDPALEVDGAFFEDGAVRQHRANKLPGVQPEKDVFMVVADFFRYFDFYTAFLPSLINRLNLSYNSCILYSKEALNYGY